MPVIRITADFTVSMAVIENPLTNAIKEFNSALGNLI